MTGYPGSHLDQNLIFQAYNLLNVKPGDSASKIKNEYRKLVGHFHPDKFSSNPEAQAQATEKMKAFNQAYSLIKNAPLTPDDRFDTPTTSYRPGGQDIPYEKYDHQKQQGLSNLPGPVRFIFGAAYVGGLLAVFVYLLGQLFEIEDTLTMLIGYIAAALLSTVAGILNTTSQDHFAKVAHGFFAAAWYVIPLLILLSAMFGSS